MGWPKAVNQQLRKISRQGMEQAAGTFSRLLQQPVSIQVIDAWMSDQSKNKPLPAIDGIGVYMAIEGDFSGGLLLFLVDNCARGLTAKLLRCEPLLELLEEPASSTLKEIGNIIASAFLASIDDQLGLRSLPTPPALSHGSIGALVECSQRDSNEPCLVVHTRLTNGVERSELLQGESYLFLSCHTMNQLVARLPKS